MHNPRSALELLPTGCHRWTNSQRKKTFRDKMIQKIPLLLTAGGYIASLHALPSPIPALGSQEYKGRGDFCGAAGFGRFDGWGCGWDDKSTFPWLRNHPTLKIKKWMLEQEILKASIVAADLHGCRQLAEKNLRACLHAAGEYFSGDAEIKVIKCLPFRSVDK